MNSPEMMKDKEYTNPGTKKRKERRGEEDKIQGILPEWCRSKSWEYWETEWAVYDSAEEGFSAADLKG